MLLDEATLQLERTIASLQWVADRTTDPAMQRRFKEALALLHYAFDALQGHGMTMTEAAQSAN